MWLGSRFAPPGETWRVVDTAVQPKAVMFPTDAKLLDRAREAAGATDDVSHPSRSTDLDILGRLLTTIIDNLIFDRLTLIERTKTGTFDSGDMDKHSAAVLGLNESIALRRVEPLDRAGSHHGLLECANIIGPHDHRATAHPKSTLSWGNASRDAQTSDTRFEPENCSRFPRRVQQRERFRVKCPSGFAVTS